MSRKRDTPEQVDESASQFQSMRVVNNLNRVTYTK